MFLPTFSSKRKLKKESFANRKKLLTEKTVFEKKMLDHFFPYRVSLCIKYFYFILLSYFSFFFSFECWFFFLVFVFVFRFSFYHILLSFLSIFFPLDLFERQVHADFFNRIKKRKGNFWPSNNKTVYGKMKEWETR